MRPIKRKDRAPVKAKTELTPDEVRLVVNAVRLASLQWSGRRIALERARRRVLEGLHKNGNPRYKYYWQCAKCQKWKRNEKEVEVDHVEEIGPYTGDIAAYLCRILCDPETGLQILCVSCHQKKTSTYASARTRWVRKEKGRV